MKCSTWGGDRSQLGWSSEEEEQLIALAAKGLTASQIGNELGKTRNAIIGKCARRGIKLLGGANHHTSGKPVAERPPRRKLVVVVPPPSVTPEQRASAFNVEAFEASQTSAPVSLQELTADACKWPIGSLFCGGMALHRKPYCQQHAAISREPARPPKPKEERKRASKYW